MYTRRVLAVAVMTSSAVTVQREATEPARAIMAVYGPTHTEVG